MKKLLLLVVCLLLLMPAKAKAELGDWKLYVIIRYEMYGQDMINYGQMVALVQQLINRFDSEPGHAEDVFVDWVQDGRQGEDADEWWYNEDTSPWLPTGRMYMGGELYSEDVALDDSEDTDYMQSMYWSASIPGYVVGNYTVMILITNRIYDPSIFGFMIPYCDYPLANTPKPVCP